MQTKLEKVREDAKKARLLETHPIIGYKRYGNYEDAEDLVLKESPHWAKEWESL